ncbi:MAG: hypothetical protein QOI61_1839 [Actinomycetota bacterium]
MTKLRWFDFIPEAILAIGLATFAITDPDPALSAFGSSKAITLMVVVSGAWIVVRYAALRLRSPVARNVPFVLAALGILSVVVLPAYDNDTVVETLSPPTSVAQAVVTGPVKLSTGQFQGIDHRAAGTVNLYRHPDGHIIVGLEEFDIQPGPAYVLYLVPGDDQHDLGGGTKLEALRGNRGTQFYDAPPGLDTAGEPWTVLVWCETFDVPVANATPLAN